MQNFHFHLNAIRFKHFDSASFSGSVNKSILHEPCLLFDQKTFRKFTKKKLNTPNTLKSLVFDLLVHMKNYSWKI